MVCSVIGSAAVRGLSSGSGDSGTGDCEYLPAATGDTGGTVTDFDPPGSDTNGTSVTAATESDSSSAAVNVAAADRAACSVDDGDSIGLFNSISNITY